MNPVNKLLLIGTVANALLSFALMLVVVHYRRKIAARRSAEVISDTELDQARHALALLEINNNISDAPYLCHFAILNLSVHQCAELRRILGGRSHAKPA